MFQAAKSLRFRLMLLVALALLPAIALTAATAAEQRALQAEGVLENSMRLARIASADQGRLVDRVRGDLEAFGKLPEVRGAWPDACDATLAELQRNSSLYAHLGVLDLDGGVRCSARLLNASEGFGERGFFRRVVRTGNFSVGGFQFAVHVPNLTEAAADGAAPPPGDGGITINATLEFGAPLRDGAGRMTGVLYLALDLAWINQRAAEAQLPPGSALLVIDRGGTVLGRYPEPEAWLGRNVAQAPLFADMARRGEGVAESADLDGRPRLYAFTPLTEPSGAGAVWVAVGIPREVAFAEVDRIFARNLSVLAGVGLLAFGLAWFASDATVLRQVNRLVRASRRLSQGDLEARAGVPYDHGELGHLARSFDEMAASLQATLARERSARADLEAANERLAQLDRMKTQFINTAAHELGTPLTPIKLQLSLLKSQAARGAASADSLELLERNVDRLTQLVGDVLEVARLQSGRLRVELRRLDLGVVVEDAAASFRGPARHHGIMLRTLLASGVEVVADERRLTQVLFNLLSNALKFTPPGGAITVETEARGGEALLRVRDTGIGIRAEDLGRLFEPFSQVEDPERPRGGTGLGLHISRGIVEQHGGRIEAASEGPGRGSTFTVALPLARRGADGGLEGPATADAAAWGPWDPRSRGAGGAGP